MPKRTKRKMSELTRWAWITTIAAIVFTIGSGSDDEPNAGLVVLTMLLYVAAVVLWVVALVRPAWRAAKTTIHAPAGRPTQAHQAPPSSRTRSSRVEPDSSARTQHPDVPRARVFAPEPVKVETAAPTPPALKKPNKRLPPAYMLLNSSRYAAREVKGEFYHRAAVLKAAGWKPKPDESITLDDLPALLVPEPGNRRDRNAIKVLLNGYHVGYLSREDAEAFNPVLTSVVNAGYTPATTGRLWLAAYRPYSNPREMKYNMDVHIRLDEPHLLLPLNDPPERPYSLLPRGRALQVTGEEHHLDVLTDYVSPEGDGFAIGTLSITKGTRPGAKEIAEVNIDGNAVGTLTPASSQHFIPAIRHLDGRGLAAAAWLRVKGSQISVQVSVLAAKSHEIPDAWFEEPQTVPRLHQRPRPEPMWDEEAEGRL